MLTTIRAESQTRVSRSPGQHIYHAWLMQAAVKFSYEVGWYTALFTTCIYYSIALSIVK